MKRVAFAFVAIAFAATINPNNGLSQAVGGCSSAQVADAQALARKVLALSKTNPTAALNMATEVARSQPACYQLAFGAVLDGTGTASVQGPAPVVSAGSPG